MIAIGAMSLFMTLGWEQFGPTALLLMAMGYCVVALALTECLLKRRQLGLPASITAGLAVVLMPLGSADW
jgi:hypothetical protein